MQPTHDLKFDDLAVQLHSPDFLQASAIRGSAGASSTHVQQRLGVKSNAYEVDADSGDVALSVGIILQHNRA